MIDRLKDLFSPRKAEREEYAPLNAEGSLHVDEDSSFFEGESEEEAPFSWVEYAVFALLGVAMLWAWYARPKPLNPSPAE